MQIGWVSSIFPFKGVVIISESGKELRISLEPVWYCCSVAKLCPTLCDPMDCSPPGSSVHGISQARILDWVAISSSRGSSRPRIKPVSPALAGGFFTIEPPGKPMPDHLKPEIIRWNYCFRCFLFSFVSFKCLKVSQKFHLCLT